MTTTMTTADFRAVAGTRYEIISTDPRFFSSERIKSNPDAAPERIRKAIEIVYNGLNTTYAYTLEDMSYINTLVDDIMCVAAITAKTGYNELEQFLLRVAINIDRLTTAKWLHQPLASEDIAEAMSIAADAIRMF